jgi:putative membrane protein
MTTGRRLGVVTMPLVVALALGTATAARAAGGGPPPITPGELVGTLHRVNQMEIDAGRMAQRRGATPTIRHYGETLEHDHRLAEDRLRQYADQHHLDLDTAPPIGVGDDLAQARGELDNLKELGGASFDSEFAELMVSSHRRAIQVVDRARATVNDPQLQALLDGLEPQLRHHEELASDFLENPGTALDPQPGRAQRRPAMH